ncbi:DASH complex subunit dad2 [Zygosaccharomyces mellis]|uniref:DASH complex subunit DAD2 n=1 Tax=Zygosaccharomyces mellis TaxID=42258 RepID=A0A4C2E2C4_9SACH|nr:DASH complex subunit dad2 [Zygosaccharomyces mellis]
MFPLEDQIEAKRKELEALKRITALTDDMKFNLDELAGQVRQINSNATSVSKVMENWNSISRSISLAGLSLLQYAEGDYEVGAWKKNYNSNGNQNNNSNDNNNNDSNNNDNNNNSNKDREEPKDGQGPLPETLVRIRMDDEN